MPPQPYSLDVADLLAQAEGESSELLRRSPSDEVLIELLGSLRRTRDHIHCFLCEEIQKEERQVHRHKRRSNDGDRQQERRDTTNTFSDAIDQLRTLIQENQALRSTTHDQGGMATDRTPFFQIKSARDTMLFRLVVVLQLCLVRIDFMRLFLVSRDNRRSGRNNSLFSSFWTTMELGTLAGLMTYIMPRQCSNRIIRYRSGMQRLVVLTASTGALFMAIQRLHGSLSYWSVARKLRNSIHALDYWTAKWVDHLGNMEFRRLGGLSRESQTEYDHISSPPCTDQLAVTQFKRLHKYQVRTRSQGTLRLTSVVIIVEQTRLL